MSKNTGGAMSGHTPGPWRADGFAVLGPDIDGDVQVIADDKAWARGTYYKPTPTEAKANARLIAAAPEMLAELRGVLEWARIERAPLREIEIASIAALIAKAEGRQP